ncbi:MAG: hypothetical protein HY553_15135 [Elusimicrobia bacterium]|nr:hypothetical protein [Elusimicrobiota bacterium]
MAEARDDDRRWESGFEGHERAQAVRLARLSLADKLAWLEEAQRLADGLQKQQPGRPRPG